MPNERDLNLDPYGISQNRYRELKYFCRQYPEKLAKLNSIRDLSAVASDGMPHSTSISDTTASKAIKAMQLSEDVKLIQDIAKEVDNFDWQFIIANVARGVPAECLELTQSRTQFYQNRRKFFYLLDKRKK